MVVLRLLSGTVLTTLYGLVQEGGEIGGAVQLDLTEAIVIGIQDTLCTESVAF